MDELLESSLEEMDDEDMELRVKALIALHHEAFKRRALYPHMRLFPRPNLLHLLPRKHLGKARVYRLNSPVQLPQYFKDRPNPRAPDQAQIVERENEVEAIEKKPTAFEEVGIEEEISSAEEGEGLLVCKEEQEDPAGLEPLLLEPSAQEQEVEQILAEQSLDAEPNELLCSDPLEWMDLEDESEGFRRAERVTRM